MLVQDRNTYDLRNTGDHLHDYVNDVAARVSENE